VEFRPRQPQAPAQKRRAPAASLRAAEPGDAGCDRRRGAAFPDNFGTLEQFGFATTAEEAEPLLEHFLDTLLPGFGDYQDAMARGEPWMWHAVISAAMNIGLIDPLDACRRAEARFREGRAPLNAVEGFIRRSSAGASSCAACTGSKCRS
jgi:deoxyribodipyrimidine photolyase-like uncharacterized protein